MTPGKTSLMCLLSAFLGALLAVAIAGMPETAPISVAQTEARELAGPLAPVSRSADQAQAATSPPIALTPEERVNVSVYETANRSAVNISTTTVRNDGLFWIEVPADGVGSGILIDRSGHVLTNSHVVDGAREVIVTLFDGKSYEARLVGMDRTNDMAVLKIDPPADTLYPVVFGDSSHLLVGQRVYAIGNPFGLQRTLSTGIISSLNRDMPSRTKNRYIKQVIQIDADINPGNSGGAAAGYGRADDRHEHRNSQSYRRERGRGLCNPGQHDLANRTPIDREWSGPPASDRYRQGPSDRKRATSRGALAWWTRGAGRAEGF